MELIFKEGFRYQGLPVISVEYYHEEIIPVRESTELIYVPLPGFDSNKLIKNSKNLLDENAFAIELVNFSCACASVKFDVYLFDKMDSLRNSINEVLEYVDVDKHVHDQDFSQYVIINKDEPQKPGFNCL